MTAERPAFRADAGVDMGSVARARCYKPDQAGETFDSCRR